MSKLKFDDEILASLLPNSKPCIIPVEFEKVTSLARQVYNLKCDDLKPYIEPSSKMASVPGKVDRQTTTPFLLKLFYKEGSFTP
jgi:hypothetical protein